MKVYTEADVEKIRQECEERIAAEKEENKKKLDKVEKEYKRKIEKLSEISKREGTPKRKKRKSEVKKDERVEQPDWDSFPMILRPEFRYTLLAIVQYLDPVSFLRFIACSKILYSLANEGFLKVFVQISCRVQSVCYSEDLTRREFPILMFDKKVLDYEQYISLSQTPYLRFDLISLDATSGEFGDYHKRLMELLDVLRITKISYLKVRKLPYLSRYFKNYSVQKFEATYSVRDISKLNTPTFLKLEGLNLTFFHVDAAAKEDIMQYILTSAATSVEFSHTKLPKEFVTDLIREWLKGEKTIEVFRFDVSSDDVVLEVDDFRGFLQVKARRNLRNVDAAFAQRKAANSGLVLIKGCQNSYIFVDENMRLIRVFFDNSYGRNTVTMSVM